MYVPDAGTVKLLGTEIRLSPFVIVPASNALVALGVNFDLLTVKLWLLLVGLKTVTTSDVAPPVGTFPKLAEGGLNHVVAFAAADRFSRPAPCAVGPSSAVPVFGSFTTRSARFTSADFTCAGDQSG